MLLYDILLRLMLLRKLILHLPCWNFSIYSFNLYSILSFHKDYFGFILGYSIVQIWISIFYCVLQCILIYLHCCVIKVTLLTAVNVVLLKNLGYMLWTLSLYCIELAGRFGGVVDRTDLGRHLLALGLLGDLYGIVLNRG